MQVLGFHAEGPGNLALFAVEEGDVQLRRVPLAGDFAWRVSPVRRCTGKLEGLAHVACPTREPVSVHGQCPACSGLEDAECIFEPRCEGNPAACTCLTTFKGVPHVVYLAFHGTLPKVGMTLRRRVARRLHEQGADAYLVLQECPDRATARSLEKQVSYLHKIPEHRSHRETLPQLARPVPWPHIATRAAEYVERLERHYDLDRVLHRVEGHALVQPLPGVPRRVQAQGLHRGTWVGAKGNHLIYREAPRPDRLDAGSAPLVALKLTDLVGRTIEPA